MSRRGAWRWLGLSLAVVLMASATGWWALPKVIRHQVNARLSEIPGYGGRVRWVSVDWSHHSYTLHDFLVVKRNGRVHWPYFYAPEIDVAVHWRPWSQGGPCGEVMARSASVTFVQGPDSDTTQMDVDARWTRAAHAVFPLPISRLEIAGGRMLYLDDCRQPNLALSMTDLHVLAQEADRAKTPGWAASVEIDGCCLGQGRVHALVLSDPRATQPHFSLTAEVSAVSLPELNDMFVAYADVGMKRGTLGMRMKIDGQGGKFDGFIKPAFDHLEFTWVGTHGRSLGRQIVGSLAAVAANVMRRQVELRLENEIPIQGTFAANENDFLATFKALARAGSRLPLAQGAPVTAR